MYTDPEVSAPGERCASAAGRRKTLRRVFVRPGMPMSRLPRRARAPPPGDYPRERMVHAQVLRVGSRRRALNVSRCVDPLEGHRTQRSIGQERCQQRLEVRVPVTRNECAPRSPPDTKQCTGFRHQKQAIKMSECGVAIHWDRHCDFVRVVMQCVNRRLSLMARDIPGCTMVSSSPQFDKLQSFACICDKLQDFACRPEIIAHCQP